MPIQVAFFSDAQKTTTTTKKEAPLLPRSNPRAFISGLYEEWNLMANFNDTSFEKNAAVHTYENGRFLVKLARCFKLLYIKYLFTPPHMQSKTVGRNYNSVTYTVINLMSNDINKASKYL